MNPSHPPKPAAVFRPHWAAVVAALIAMAGLFISGEGYWGLIALAAAMLVPCVTRMRLPGNAVLVWFVRAAMFAMVIATADTRRERGSAWMPDLYDPSSIYLFGYLCAAELALQCWKRQRTAAPHGEILVLSALVMAAGACTYDRLAMRCMAPAFALFLALSFRATRPALPGARRVAMRVRARRYAGVALALAVGGITAEATALYGEKVTFYPGTWIGKWLKQANMNDVGLSYSPRLSATSHEMQPSPLRVLRVEGLAGQAHLRALAFDTYDNGGWGPSLNERSFRPARAKDLGPDASGRRLRITRLVESLHLLCAPLNAAGLAPMAGAEIEWDADPVRIVRSWTDAGTPYQYEVILGDDPAHQGPLCAPLSAEQRKRCLAVPEAIAPDLRRLAREIADRPQPLERVRAVQRYLLANHSYSLSARPASNDDPTRDFLLNKRSAHCQFFASATVLLLRCVDVPARYVTGYYAHEMAPDRSIVVRQRDAHAWAECFIDGLGWISVDATPPSGLPDQAFEPVGSAKRIWELIGDWAGRIKAWFLANWLRVILITLGLVVAAWALRALFVRLKARRPAKSKIPYLYPDNDLADVARAFEALLRQRGLACAANRTWREQLGALDRPDAEARLDLELAEAFLAEYEHIRFGPMERRAGVAKLHELLSQLERA